MRSEHFVSCERKDLVIGSSPNSQVTLSDCAIEQWSDVDSTAISRKTEQIEVINRTRKLKRYWERVSPNAGGKTAHVVQIHQKIDWCHGYDHFSHHYRVSS
jgi:hypothetical protein